MDSDIVYGVLALLGIAALGTYWPLVSRYVAAIEKRVRDSQLRRDVLDYVLAARRIYDDYDQALAYVLEMAQRRYPDLDIDHVQANVEAIFEWIERNLDLEVYIGEKRPKE